MPHLTEAQLYDMNHDGLAREKAIDLAKRVKILTEVVEMLLEEIPHDARLKAIRDFKKMQSGKA